MGIYGSLEAYSVASVRRSISTSVRGINQVEVDTSHYLPDESLEEWVNLNKDFFFYDGDDRLVPRGVLLHGKPGVGKTQGAKYIAREFSLPLYHLDIGAILGKYIGDSEGQMNQALERIDRESPCIILVDEIEKIFKSSDDSGVTSRLLARLLWWMQEHSSRVLTVMTSNSLDILPPELYRPGRIDDLILLQGINLFNVKTFVSSFLSSFSSDKVIGVSSDYRKHIINTVMDIVESTGYATKGGNLIAHADLVTLTIDTIKKYYKDNNLQK
jgi:SpoVK/Ycf46/Vps4 family AAA+-type ATPase